MKEVIVIGGIVILCAVVAYSLLKQFETPLPDVHHVSLLPAKYGKAAEKKPNSYLIKNVSVIPIRQDTVLLNRNVFIEDGRITAIKSAQDNFADTSTPFVIEGSGKYLIPGLNDMHVHVNDDNNLLLFIANGVTTVRNMAGLDFHLKLREKIDRLEILGPAFYTTGPILEGVNKVWGFSIALKTKNEARDAVKKYKQEGYDFLKVYHTLPKEIYEEILRVADSIGIPVVGHIPFSVNLERTLALSQYSLEHVDLRPISPGIPLQTREKMIGESKKWMCPTLVVYRNLQKNPGDSVTAYYEQFVDSKTKSFWKSSSRYHESVFSLQKKMAERIFHYGGRFIVGTDCLNSYVLAGFSIHEELQELVNAGIPEYEVLKASTLNAAEFLKSQHETGTIEAGKIADLVLLQGNPLEDIANTKQIQGVFVKGKWFDASELDNILEDVKRSYTNDKD